MVFTKSALGFFDFSLLTLVFTAVHNFFRAKFVDLLFPKLTLDLSLFSSLVSMSLVDLGLSSLVVSSDGCLCFVLDFVAIATFVHVVEHLVFTHVILVISSCDLTLKNFLELVDVIAKEV